MRSVPPTAISAREKIIDSALGLFAERGIEASSLRQVAKTCDVSPALVVHHFGGKEGLVEAVDDWALRKFSDAYASAEPAEGTELLQQRAAQTARVMREHPAVCAYIGRALIERTPGTVRFFRVLIEGGRREIDSLATAGALREDADRTWVTLQHFFLIWAPLSFMPLLGEVLDGPLLDESNLDRWVNANVELLEKGIYR